MKALAAALVFVSAGLGGGEAVMAEPPSFSPQQIAELQREVVRLRQENTVAGVELDRLRQVIARLEAELAEVRRQLERSASVQDDAEMDPTPAAPADAAPLTESTPVEEEVLTDEELDGPARPEVEPDTAREAVPVHEPVALQEVTPAARTLYDDSYTLFHEKRYGEAESGFQLFLELHAATDLTDNAQFWIGECRFAQGRYQAAFEAFRLTVERFPDGNKVPDALYKAGRCLESLGDSQRAVATYEETVHRFPSSAAAASAQERLAELR